ncbi:MAG: uracil-DNA glycosylase [Streptococcaceae bacterium]|nr:uracil-DNA glycosylase [Streptococcaceae bacterium]
MEEILPSDWQDKLFSSLRTESFVKLSQFVAQEYENKTIYPAKENIFQALKLTPYSKVRVVILGQDPYHGENQAHGLSFSVKEGIAFPPSLKNIFKEYQEDTGLPEPKSGDLTKWTKEGVLLLNTVLTVQQNCANAHAKKGWEEFTDEVIKAINKKNTPVIFILWGKASRAKRKLIFRRHIILEASHPSPLSAYHSFFGSKPFSTINAKLLKLGEKEIDWQLN